MTELLVLLWRLAFWWWERQQWRAQREVMPALYGRRRT